MLPDNSLYSWMGSSELSLVQQENADKVQGIACVNERTVYIYIYIQSNISKHWAHQEATYSHHSKSKST